MPSRLQCAHVEKIIEKGREKGTKNSEKYSLVFPLPLFPVFSEKKNLHYGQEL